MLMLKMPRERKELLIEQVKRYFAAEHGQEMGNLAAEMALDFFVQTVGPDVYNQAVEECRDALVRGMGAIEDDLYALQKPLRDAR